MEENTKLNSDINLPSCNLGEFSLDNVNAKYILFYFYPKDNTPGCTTESIEFSELKDEFEKLDVSIFGISKDDINSHKKFIEKYDLKIDLLVDDKNLAEKFGVWVEKNMYGKKYMGIERSSFLIDREAKTIVKIWKKVKPQGHAKQVLEYIKSL